MRTYQETVNWLFDNLPMFQNVGKEAVKKLDLSNITAFCETLGNPQNQYKTIHIAGTNGKGSTSHMIASILQEAGYKVGLTTSPHLKDFRERIRVNGEMCSEEFVVNFVDNNQQNISKLHASFFEISVGMAFKYFAEQNVDIAVIETGLGGRLDSTNIIHPILSVITNIGLDHTQFLGDTLPKIASEKAGIIKPKTPVVIGESNNETKDVFIDYASRNESKIIFAEDELFPDYESDLKGSYQRKNKQTVLHAIAELQNLGFDIKEEQIRKGLQNVIKNTNLRGRWDILQSEKPLIIADTAHNPHGLIEIANQIKEINYKKLRLVLGFVNDKDVLTSLDFFPKDAKYYFTQPNVPRKYKIEDLKKIIPNDLDANYFSTVKEAIEIAKKDSSEEDFIYIGGSTFVVAEAL